MLQKMLSIYHPLKNVIYQEHDQVQEAGDDLDYIELEIEALNIAKDLDIEIGEGILRVEVGSQVSKMTSKEIKRDLLLCPLEAVIPGGLPPRITVSRGQPPVNSVPGGIIIFLF